MRTQASTPVSIATPRTTAEIADELDQLYLKTGDKCFARSARALRRNETPGRPPVDDTEALEEIANRIQSGKFGTLNQLFLDVSTLRWPDSNPRSTAARLRRKFFCKSST